MNVLAKTPVMRITKIKDHIGAEVTGVDLTKPIDEETRQRLYDAAVDNVALVIRDQKFTPAQYANAARLFGELMEDQNRRYLAPGEPMVSTLSNHNKDSQGNQAKVVKSATWHTDHTNQEFPPKSPCYTPSNYPIAGAARESATCVTPMKRCRMIGKPGSTA
jgi:taurine dioxygenase